MKKIICFTLLLCMLLTGCGMGGGKVHSPFLTESQRGELEKSLSDSLRIVYEPENPDRATLSLRHESGYRLNDISMVDLQSHIQLFYLADFPVGEELRIPCYSEDDWETVKNHTLSVNYTIGDYSYYTENITTEIVSEENAGAPDLKLSMSTVDGEITLSNHETKEFTVGNEIDGISAFRVYSVTAEGNYSEYEGQYSSLELMLEGREPAGYMNLIIKLIDENDLVRAVSSAYFSDGTANVYFFCSLQPELSYRLQFTELD